MKFSLEIQGLQQAIEKLSQVQSGVTAELEESLENEAAFPLWYAVASYPLRPSLSSYVRTFQYLDTIESRVRVVGSEVQYTLTTPAPYAIYLRGDLDGRRPAWMHLGIWRSLQDIADKLIPVVSFHIQARIDQFIRRVWGG